MSIEPVMALRLTRGISSTCAVLYLVAACNSLQRVACSAWFVCHSMPEFVIGFAADPGKLSFEDERRRNGVYTEALLANLSTHGAARSITDVLGYARKYVFDSSKGKQRPWMHECLLKKVVLLRPDPMVRHAPPEPPLLVQSNVFCAFTHCGVAG